MTSLDEIKAVLEQDSRFKELKELEGKMDSDPKIVELLHLKQEYSQQIILSKHIGLTNNVKYYEDQYDLVNQSLEEYPKMNEYMDLLNEYHSLYKEMIEYIQKEINKKLI